jgi:hypothetical protein
LTKRVRKNKLKAPEKNTMNTPTQFSIYDAAPGILRPAEATLAAHGLQAAWQVYLTPDATGGREEATIRDIVWRLESRGSLSDPQVNYLRSLVARIAQRSADRASAADCPTGRMEITGTVVSVKEVETRFGMATKMLIRHADGWKVWGTVPRALDTPAKGDTVTLTATVEPSRDDPKFGFYSRPTGARVTPQATEEN